MFKFLSIVTALVVIGVGSAKAQERQAVFQKVTVPGASYDMIIAVANPGSPVVYFRDQPISSTSATGL